MAKKTETQVEFDSAPLTMEPNPKISTRYDYASIARPEVSFPKDDPNSLSVTNQSDKDSTDINLIMARYEKTGFITDLLTGQRRQPVFGDFTGISDFHQLQITLSKAQTAFDVLPASTRNKFGNDPANLINFLADQKNDDEAIKLGLKEKPVVNPPKAENAQAPKAENAQAPLVAAPGQPANPAA